MSGNEVSRIIIGCAIEVHRILGPGLLESVCLEALAWEIGQKGLLVERQVEVPFVYKGVLLKAPLRLDLLVQKLVIVEVKSVEKYNPIYEAQTLTYLRLSNLKLGLVINFGEKLVRDGVHRVVNG